jgi:hypothetical protein
MTDSAAAGPHTSTLNREHVASGSTLSPRRLWPAVARYPLRFTQLNAAV